MPDRPRRGRPGAALPAPSPRRHAGELDLPGAVTGTLGLLGLVYGFSRAGADGWTDPWTIASLVAGVVLLAVVPARREPGRAPAAAVPGVHATAPARASFAAMFLAPAAMFAMFFFLSQYIQNVMGYSPIEAGVAFLPFCVGIVVAAGHRVQPGQPDRPALSSPAIGTLMAAAGAVRVLAAAVRHHLPGRRP